MKNKIGIFAQEAKIVVPEIVNDNDEYMSIPYSPRTTLMVEIIMEQHKIIDELKRRI